MHAACWLLVMLVASCARPAPEPLSNHRAPICHYERVDGICTQGCRRTYSVWVTRCR